MRIRRFRSVLVIAVTVLAGLGLAGVVASQASASSRPEPCSEPPAVDVDQSDPAFSTITISLACETDTQFHRIITATVGGVEVLKIDTRTDVAADAAHKTTITIPKAQVCVTDPDADEQSCLPSASRLSLLPAWGELA